jgi:hypothetical protein
MSTRRFPDIIGSKVAFLGFEQHPTHTGEQMNTTLADLIDRHGIDVDPHLDRQVSVPVNTGLQRQGDVIVIPTPRAREATTPVPQTGLPVVRGEAGGNTHALVADGPGVRCDLRDAGVRSLLLGTLTVPEGAVAYLAHPEHAYTGIGPGTYEIRRQREQADEIRVVAD